MHDLSKKQTRAIAFSLLYVAFCISYIDRAAISLALGQIGKDFNRDPLMPRSAFLLSWDAKIEITVIAKEK
jgi:hypothetical protein